MVLGCQIGDNPPRRKAGFFEVADEVGRRRSARSPIEVRRPPVAVRSRGDREAFTVSENRGAGVVLAVRADHPFNFEEFTTGHHWNAAALAPDSGTGGDPQACVLLIDDDHTARQVVGAYLVDHGMRVVAAGGRDDDVAQPGAALPDAVAAAGRDPGV